MIKGAEPKSLHFRKSFLVMAVGMAAKGKIMGGRQSDENGLKVISFYESSSRQHHSFSFQLTIFWGCFPVNIPFFSHNFPLLMFSHILMVELEFFICCSEKSGWA